MNNCGQQPVMVPTWVELDTRDLEVRDLACTNGSFKTLSINGDPVVLNTNMTFSKERTDFDGDVHVSTVTYTNSLNAVTQVSANELIANSASISGELYVANGLKMGPPNSEDQVGWVVNGSNMLALVLNTTTSTATTMDLTAGIWRIDFSVAYYVTTSTAVNSIILRFYEQDTNTRNYYSSVPIGSAVYAPSIQGSMVLNLTTDLTVKLGTRLGTVGPTVNISGGYFTATRIS
jgi:hypothetical protein